MSANIRGASIYGKKGIRRKNKIIHLSVLALLCLAMFTFLKRDDIYRWYVSKYVIHNQEYLYTVAEQMMKSDHDISGEIKYGGKKWTISYWSETGQVSFLDMNGFSFKYRGFYYSPNDYPLHFQGADSEFDLDNSVWFWNEPKSNNREWTGRIEKNWFWFEAYF